MGTQYSFAAILLGEPDTVHVHLVMLMGLKTKASHCAKLSGLLQHTNSASDAARYGCSQN